MYPWHETGQVKGFLYLVETPCLPTWVKIGFSNNVARRIKELNTAVPVPFRLIQAWASNDHKIAEKICHSAFAQFRSEYGTEHFRLQTGIEHIEYDDEYTGVFTDIVNNSEDLVDYIDRIIWESGIQAEQAVIADKNDNII